MVTPLDLERTYGMTEGNIFHGDLSSSSSSSCGRCRGGPTTARRSEGLYLCGAGVHPGGGVTGAPGYSASHSVLRDLKKGR